MAALLPGLGLDGKLDPKKFKADSAEMRGQAAGQIPSDERWPNPSMASQNSGPTSGLFPGQEIALAGIV